MPEQEKEPDTFNHSYLSELRVTRNNALTKRKLTSEFVNIKNKVLTANNSGQTTINYIYNYISDSSVNDYFVSLLTKLADFFPDSKITYILNTNTDMTTAITVEDVSTKSETAVKALMELNTSDASLDTSLNTALAALQDSKRLAQANIQRLSVQSISEEILSQESPPESISATVPITFNRANLNSNLVSYNSSNSNNSTINIIQIDWTLKVI
jgi:hypothetical protein